MATHVKRQEIHYSINRVGFFTISAIIFIALCLARLFYLQVVHGAEYKQKAVNQYVPLSAPIFNRGSVMMRSKNGDLTPLASLEEFYTLTINPNQVRDAVATYEAFKNAGVAVDKAVFLEKSAKKNDQYEEIAKNVPKKIVEALKVQNLKGVTYVKNFRRFYPQKNVGSQVIGFVGNDGATVRGQYGLERTYDDVLEQVSNIPMNVFAEAFSDIGDTLQQKVKKEDADIVLTLDPNMEQKLHDILAETKATWGSREIGGIIMDPRTGAILAMDALPSFDPNTYSDSKAAQYTNPNVEAVHEMGSIIKTLTMAAGLDAGVVTENTTYNDTGTIILNGYKVSNFDKRARGVIPMQKVLDQSLNVGATFVQQRLGKKLFAEYFTDAFGLGAKTGIDVPNEVKSLTKNLSSREDVNYATASFGQGIALTPIATIRALATLGNGGMLVTPHIVDEIVYKDGRREKVAYASSTRALKKETSETITHMLVKVVDTALLGGTMKMDDYAVAAKTGTAEIPTKSGGYRTDAFLHSFMAYFPAYDPQFIVLLYHLEPQGNSHAAETLSPAVFKIAKYALSYYGVPPDRK
jgi:stage V sporulation protein D (sporulation-specific penicillin-binding protein)